MEIVLLSLVYAFDLVLFVLVFVIVRQRRVSAEWKVTIVLVAACMYLASLALFVAFSSKR